jgi:hypothetical protein
MLGHLKMSIGECITKYEKMMPIIFEKSVLRFGTKGEFYDAGVLESVIKDLIREKHGNDDVLLLDENNPCKMCRALMCPRLNID